MIFKKTMWISFCIMMLTACGDKPKDQEVNLSVAQVKANHDASTVTDKADADKVAKAEWDKIVDFQREVIPVLEDAINKQFLKNDLDAFLDQADYYFDNDDVNNLKVVFHVDKEDTKEMKALRKELEEKLGEKVIFKKAKHNPKVLHDLTKVIADYVVTINEKGESSSVGYNSKEEVINIEAKLTDEQIDDLKQKFGADILRITNKDPKIITLG